MRLILILVLGLCTVIPVMAQTPFQSLDEAEHWFSFYYTNPEPERLAPAVRYLSQQRALDNPGTLSTIAGFLAAIFRDQPQRVPTLITQFETLPESHLGIVVLGLWHANLPDTRQRVSSLLERRPQLKARYTGLMQDSPAPLEQVPLDQSPWTIEALWGEFIATGSSTPVMRVVSGLAWEDKETDVLRLTAADVARRSLLENALRHRRVLQILEAQSSTQNAELRKKLQEIVSHTRRQIELRTAPAPVQPTSATPAQ